MANSPLKLLAIGDVRGKFSQFMKRINSVNAKNGPFEMILCVGDFFGEDLDQEQFQVWTDIKSGKVKVPVPIYLLGPMNDGQKGFYPDLEGKRSHNYLDA